jgi:CRP-like cAMP-binding protein
MVDIDAVERLRAIPIFAGLDEAALQRLSVECAEVEAPAGHVLVQAREPGSGLYVVEEGTVAVEYRDESIELGPGDFFGELSLLVEDATRSARVRALTPVRCLAVGRAEFTELLESEPTVALTMLRTLARRFLDEIERT